MTIPIALQLYCVREDCEKDLAAVLDAVAEMGYEGVEFAGYYDRGAEELRQMLDARGLVCCGTHTRIDTLLGDALAETIAFNKTLGNPFLIVPGLPEEMRNSRAAPSVRLPTTPLVVIVRKCSSYAPAPTRDSTM